jgi:hypothetical protein
LLVTTDIKVQERDNFPAHHSTRFCEAQMKRSAARAIQARFPGKEFAALENWRRQQDEIPPLSAAMRILVKRGLAASAPEHDQRSEAEAAT